MTPINIAVIVGSLRRDSFNAKLAHAIAKLAPADLTFTRSQIDDLPLYNQDDDSDQVGQVKRLKASRALHICRRTKTFSSLGRFAYQAASSQRVQCVIIPLLTFCDHEL